MDAEDKADNTAPVLTLLHAKIVHTLPEVPFRNQTLTLHFQYFSDKILRMKRQKVLFLSILRSDPAALSS